MYELLIPVVASIIWSINPAVIYKFAKNSPPLFFTAIRALFAMLIICLLVFHNGSYLYNPPLLIWIIMIISAVLGPGVGDAAYTRAIQLLGGSLAVVISYTYIFFAQLFSTLLVGEVITSNALVGGLVAFTGIIIATYNGEVKVNKRGMFFAISAAMGWGLATVLIKLVQEYFDELTLTLYRLIVVFISVRILSSIAREHRVLTRGFLFAALITGIFGWGVGMVLYIHSIYLLGISATVIATAMTPVLSQIVIRVVAGEKPSMKTIIGAVFVALGIVIYVANPPLPF